MPQVTRAAKAAKIRPCQHYRKLKSSVEYRAAFDACLQIGFDALSDVAIERAQIGWDEPVIYKGQLSYPEVWSEELGQSVPDRTQQPFSVRKIDNNLLQFVLKNRHPDYREREDKNTEATTAPPLIIQTYNDSPLETAVPNLPQPSQI